MKKATIKELEKKLISDENSWLKSIGELGDMARMLIELRVKIANLEERMLKMEGSKDAKS